MRDPAGAAEIDATPGSQTVEMHRLDAERYYLLGETPHAHIIAPVEDWIEVEP